MGKNIGMLLLAIFLIVYGVVTLGVAVPYVSLILGVLAVLSGIFILIGK